MKNDLTSLPESIANMTNLRLLNVNQNTIDLKAVPEALKNSQTAKVWNSQYIPQEILPNLYLGCIESAKNKEGLKARNVTHVLTINMNLKSLHPDEFTYKIVTVEDSEDSNLIEHFEDCAEFIDNSMKAGGSVLVHWYF
jgi:hypothetical protein